MTKIMDKDTIDKARTARHLLPDPGPEVVGDFIATYDKLLEYASHKNECMFTGEGSLCDCGFLEHFGDPKMVFVIKVAVLTPEGSEQVTDALSGKGDKR